MNKQALCRMLPTKVCYWWSLALAVYAIFFTSLICPATPINAVEPINAMEKKLGFTLDTVPQGSGLQDCTITEVNERTLKFLDMIQKSNVRWIRSPGSWASIETSKGVYDFSKTLAFLDEVEKRGMGSIFIVGFSNANYGKFHQAPKTQEARDAFVNFVAEAAKVFKGRRVMMDIWNEPNCVGDLNLNQGFWQYPLPLPTKAEAAKDFILLANAAIKTGHRASPEAIFIGPSTSGIDWEYLNECFKNGLLEEIDAVAVHPYRIAMPENAINDYKRLRANIDFYSKDRYIPIISTELSLPSSVGEGKQAAMMTRYWLVHYLLGIPAVWFSAGDEDNSHVGIFKNDLTPKLAYQAAQILNAFLDGYKCATRIRTENEEDYLLLFEKKTRETIRYRLATWTTGLPHKINLPLADTKIHGVDMLGGIFKIDENKDGTVSISLTGDPCYLAPEINNETLKLWSCVRLDAEKSLVESGVPAGSQDSPKILLGVRNIFPHPISGKVTLQIPASVSGNWSQQPSFTLKPNESKTLEWAGGVQANFEGRIRIPVSLQIEGMPEMKMQVSLYAAKPGLALLAKGKKGESWSISKGKKPVFLSATNNPEKSTGVRMDYDYDPIKNQNNSLTITLGQPQPRDLSGYEAIEFDIFVPEGSSLPLTIQVFASDGNGRCGQNVTEPRTKTGWQHMVYPFAGGLWMENVPGDYRDINREGIVSFSFAVVEKGSGNGSFSIRNLGLRRQLEKVPLGTNPWNIQ